MIDLHKTRMISPSASYDADDREHIVYVKYLCGNEILIYYLQQHIMLTISLLITASSTFSLYFTVSGIERCFLERKFPHYLRQQFPRTTWRSFFDIVFFILAYLRNICTLLLRIILDHACVNFLCICN